MEFAAGSAAAMSLSKQIVCSPRASERITAARAWIGSIAPGTEALVVAASHEAADDLLRELTVSRGAIFGVHRLTLNRLIGVLAAEHMVNAGLAPAAGLAAEAVAARAVFRLKPTGRLSYFGPVVERPGFPAALARTVVELRLNGVEPARLATLGGAGASIAAMLEQFEVELREANLLDRAGMIDVAIARVTSDSSGDSSDGSLANRRFVGLPTLFLDVSIEGARECDLIAALVARAPSAIATVPIGDTRTRQFIVDAMGPDAVVVESDAGDSEKLSDSAAPSLLRLQCYLFAERSPPEGKLDASVDLFSAPGEMQECVEIARRIQAEVRRSVPFDKIAVLLHAPMRYAPYLEEALDRAGIPAYFARGTARPEPGGRALLALLRCAAENLSARRFAEYLSLAQVPDAASPAGDPGGELIARDVDLAAGALRDDLEIPVAVGAPDASGSDPVPVVEKGLRAPWRWEKLLLDAAVIGGRDRWEKRLRGLEAELRLQRSEVEDDARALGLDRRLLDLEHLRGVALPLIDALAALPQAATWAEWLASLRALVEIGVRDRVPVLAALVELEPMGPVGPITLDEVRMVLAERLGRLEDKPHRRRYGAVFVAPTSYARGLNFDVTIVPGLAERVFPKKLTEDPVLADAMRRQLDAKLTVQAERVASERLALRLAAGAARSRTIFSYPRVDLDQGRPRVPSFYALEIIQAATGKLLGFDELARHAAGGRATRLGWPAPDRPEEAIDDIEFDLAVLDKLVDADPETTIGAAHYLLSANDHLGRALRARARRWLRRWTANDGLVEPEPSERAVLARHQLDSRPYSPTALQNFAACPYRFFLQAIHRLEPREEIEAIEVIDPLTRGALFHEVQFELLTSLRAAGQLPLMRDKLDEAYQALDRALAGVAAHYHEELAPAIERVWHDGIDSIKADLREWVRRMAEDRERWCPERFELAFGLSDRSQADPASVEAPIALAGGLSLRGSIDLVERGLNGTLRVTDHKTGRVRAEKKLVIGGGKTLQPVLYALAVERILKEPVESGRLYYCTAAGGYEERVVALDDDARAAAAEFTRVVGKALGDGFLPAAPDRRECTYCDYRRVCGPYEETRVEHKPDQRLADLKRLRGMR